MEFEAVWRAQRTGAELAACALRRWRNNLLNKPGSVSHCSNLPANRQGQNQMTPRGESLACRKQGAERGCRRNDVSPKFRRQNRARPSGASKGTDQPGFGAESFIQQPFVTVVFAQAPRPSVVIVADPRFEDSINVLLTAIGPVFPSRNAGESCSTTPMRPRRRADRHPRTPWRAQE